MKLSKAEHRFDDPKHRFHRAFPASVYGSALLCLQPVLHGLDGIGLSSQGRRISPTLFQRQVVAFASGRNEGSYFYFISLTSVHVVLAVVAMVGQQGLGLPQRLGRCFRNLLLVA